MLTTDPLYFRPLLPVITIKNTANNTTLYTYSSFTGAATGTGLTNVFPLYCSVNLSQNTFGEFTIQFEDQNKVIEPTVTVGSRVIIQCGKQSSALTSLISGIVRKKGYARGVDSKVLYTISGSSTGIRLNEIVTYVISEARKLATGAIDFTDSSRQADALLANSLSGLTADGVLSIANLATNSDVETFIPSLAIEYGELQDVVNYIEGQSGGEVIVDTTDLVNFRHEIKNNLFGRGFTIKNVNTNAVNDDADDTMYLRGKNWSYEDDFFKSSNYANRLYSLLSPETVPSTREDMGFDAVQNTFSMSSGQEVAYKLRPTHSHFLPGDIMVVGAQHVTSGTVSPWPTTLRIAGPDPNTGSSGNTNNLDVLANVQFLKTPFSDPLPISLVSGLPPDDAFKVMSEQIFYDATTTRIDFFDLDTTKEYWFIFSNIYVPASVGRFSIGRKSVVDTGTYLSNLNAGSGFSSVNLSGTTWAVPPTASENIWCIFLPKRRSISFSVWDPKAVQAVSTGLTAGLYVDSVLTDLSSQVKTKESMYRHLSGQLYEMARPRTTYSFPRVTAPNIPPFPGDPIVISDDILGFSTSGNQVVLTTCGDMHYQWGDLGSGGYEAPTNLSINAITVNPRYQ